MRCVRCSVDFLRAKDFDRHPCATENRTPLSYSLRTHPSGIKVACHECGSTEIAGDRDGAVWWLALHLCSAVDASRPASGTAGADIPPSAPATLNTYEVTRRPSWRKVRATGHLTKGGF